MKFKIGCSLLVSGRICHWKTLPRNHLILFLSNVTPTKPFFGKDPYFSGEIWGSKYREITKVFGSQMKSSVQPTILGLSCTHTAPTWPHCSSMCNSSEGRHRAKKQLASVGALLEVRPSFLHWLTPSSSLYLCGSLEFWFCQIHQFSALRLWHFVSS